MGGMVMRDHGGDLSAAKARYGNGDDWIDLSTGINRRAWPVAPLPPSAWRDLPTHAARRSLIEAAARAFGARAETVLPLAGAQAAIQLVPRLRAPGVARVLAPTYNEHAGALSDAGWTVREVTDPGALEGADLAVVVNPNNPDGRSHAPQALRDLSARVGLLVVDESFADPHPELSVADQADDRMLVLRSFGKFYGLAGVRLGFALGGPAAIAALSAMAGPWAVSGPALAIGAAALGDTAWARATIARLNDDARRLDALAAGKGWPLVGGTALFRTYETPDAAAAQDALARAHVWTRRFAYSARWLRLGLPDGEDEWARLAEALR